MGDGVVGKVRSESPIYTSIKGILVADCIIIMYNHNPTEVAAQKQDKHAIGPGQFGYVSPLAGGPYSWVYFGWLIDTACSVPCSHSAGQEILAGCDDPMNRVCLP